MKFLILGSMPAIIYKDIFSMFMEEKIWLGGTGIKSRTYISDFINGSLIGSLMSTSETHLTNGKKVFENTCWFTNLPLLSPPPLPKLKCMEEILSQKKKFPQGFIKYDNYNAIEIPRVEFIPSDYYGIMGVPITFAQFLPNDTFSLMGEGSENSREVLSQETMDILGYQRNSDDQGGCPLINGKRLYNRLFIKRKS